MSWSKNTSGGVDNSTMFNQTSELPSWLSTSKDVENPSSGKDWDSAESAVTSPTAGDGSVSSRTTSKRRSTKLSTGGGAADDASATTKNQRTWCGMSFVSFLSLCFIAVFVFAALKNKHDSGSFVVYIFYGLHSLVAACFLIHYWCCFPNKILYLFFVGMIIWSTIALIIGSLQFKKTYSHEEHDQKQEYIIKLAGVSIGLFSALYHLFMVCCTVKPTRNDN